MSITETRPATGSTSSRSDADRVASTPAAPSGLHGWISTADHKRIGRLYLATAVAFLVVGSVVGAILGAERLGSGLEILSDNTFGQVYTLHGEVAVFGFLVPFFLGLATYLVPLQVGAPDIAFARGAALGYWTYLVSGLLLLAAYAANGGPRGGSDVGVDLHLLALIGLNLALVVGLISVLTTALAWRTQGMSLLRTPLFTWSFVVGGGLTLLACPVLVARLVEGYVSHHFGDVDLPSSDTSWFFAVPQVFMLAVPAAGVAAEVIPVMARSRHRVHGAAVVILGLLGVLGFGAWAQLPERNDELLYVGMALAALLPALALLGLLGDTTRRGRLSLGAANLLALGAVVHLLLGALGEQLRLGDGELLLVRLRLQRGQHVSLAHLGAHLDADALHPAVDARGQVHRLIRDDDAQEAAIDGRGQGAAPHAVVHGPRWAPSLGRHRGLLVQGGQSAQGEQGHQAQHPHQRS